MSIVRNSDDTYAGIQCDECSVLAPDAATCIAAHGLARLGWYVHKGRHICPAHPHPEKNDA